MDIYQITNVCEDIDGENIYIITPDMKESIDKLKKMDLYKSSGSRVEAGVNFMLQ